MWMNVYLLQLGQHGAVLMPKAFCPSSSADDDAEEEDALFCRRSWLSFANDFWESASTTNRRRIFEVQEEAKAWVEVELEIEEKV